LNSGFVRNQLLFVFSLALWLSTSCKPGNADALIIPKGWPVPNIPDDKAVNEERILLGRKLFYDPILSLNQNVSCASCHKPELAFADSVPVSSGANEKFGNRNTPGLFNVAWYPHFLAEGGVSTLELASIAPIHNESEMDFNIGDAVTRLANDEVYRQLFHVAYDTLPSTYTLVRALGAFQRSLISGNSPYDRYLLGEKTAISESARRGMKLFFSDSLACSSCHSGFLFTDFGFHNLGLPANEDPGRFLLTSKPADRGRFRTPSLRNAALSAPYMHNGSIRTLNEVIRFYEAGGGESENKSEQIRPFRLSDDERADVLAFLNSLTDSSAIHNADYLPLDK